MGPSGPNYGVGRVHRVMDNKMQRRTKIICTMGPAVNTPETILQLLDAGMNVARINFSHGTHEEHEKVIRMLQEARAATKQPLAIMLDTKGPEIRVSRSWKERSLQAHEHIWMGPENPGSIPVNPIETLSCMQPGMSVLFDDGYLMAKILRSDPTQGVEIEILNDGVLKAGKSINLPGATVNLPALTEQDKKDLAFGVQMGVDLVAASFVRSADHVHQIRQWLSTLGAPDVQIVAKIENAQGIRNFDEIVRVSDGIMVARGDLGVELPIAQVPRLQKMMIRKCFQASKPVVTATQMLESMIHHPRPTRAEVSDVANAIYDSTSAVMLSGETAVGAYPVDAVRTMREVIEETEQDINFRDLALVLGQQVGEQDIPTAVALASVKTAYASGARAIFAFTHSGATARLISRLRPAMPILGFTPLERRYHQMSLLWGVIPCHSSADFQRNQAFEAAYQEGLRLGLVENGDLVVVIAGTPFGVPGSTNSMIVETIGDLVARGQPGVGSRVAGALHRVPASQELATRVPSKSILLVEDHFLTPELARDAAGIILIEGTHISEGERQEQRTWLKKLGVAMITVSSSHPLRCEEGEVVTIDPRRGLIFRGEPSPE